MALLAAAGGALAESPDATDDAFGALLAMPGAQPKEGGWIVPQEAAKDEDDLIAQLQDLKQDGANFNAMRHGGTLLAHAIRAGKERTAIWLLRNGADPRKPLLKDDENADDLARKYKRDAVVKVLEAKYGLKPTPAVAPVRKAAPTPPAAPASAAAPKTRVEQTVALMARLDSPLRYGNEQAVAAATQEWERWSAALSPQDFAAVFQDGTRFDSLVFMTRRTDKGLQQALDRLPDDLVRRHAQAIADALASWSFVTYSETPRIEYSSAARSWPALWRRLDRPLRYDHDHAVDLAGSIPPALWPGLFASGYANHKAEVTGCLLAMVDLPQLEALWPDFQRDFADAREEAPALVLGDYRIDRERHPCYHGSDPAETAAKLAFLRAQGVTAPVYGLRSVSPDEPLEPALAAMMKAFTPTVASKPRLVRVAPACALPQGERWLEALVKPHSVGWGIAPMHVQLIELPQRADCGLVVSGDTYPWDYPPVSDDFDEGPSREPPTPRCADTPDDGEIWVLDGDAVHRVEAATPTRSSGFLLRKARDVETGKEYVFDAGQTGAMCSLFFGLPSAFEWRTGAKGPTLVPSADGELLDRLLRRQCRKADERSDVECPGLDLVETAEPDKRPAPDRLREGRIVPLRDLVDVLGAERRAAYRAALAAHDHEQLRQLLALGIPAWWSADELRALATSDLPLDEKRRRIALLFADPGQLASALAEAETATSLGRWLPSQDWGPILRLVRKDPGKWVDARALFDPADARIGCELDRAQGFLCKGGLQP